MVLCTCIQFSILWWLCPATWHHGEVGSEYSESPTITTRSLQVVPKMLVYPFVTAKTNPSVTLRLCSNEGAASPREAKSTRKLQDMEDSPCTCTCIFHHWMISAAQTAHKLTSPHCSSACGVISTLRECMAVSVTAALLALLDVSCHHFLDEIYLMQLASNIGCFLSSISGWDLFHHSHPILDVGKWS